VRAALALKYWRQIRFDARAQAICVCKPTIGSEVNGPRKYAFENRLGAGHREECNWPLWRPFKHEVHIAIRSCFIAGDGAEEGDMRNASRKKLVSVCADNGDDVGLSHVTRIAQGCSILKMKQRKAEIAQAVLLTATAALLEVDAAA
jgi:hypothetical protein